MTKANYWANDDGLVVGFGTRTSEDQRAGVTRTAGEKNQYVVEFEYDDLPQGSSTVDKDLSYARLPDNALILDAYLEVLEAFGGGTSYDIGLDKTDGTAIDADGLWDALALADINAVGERSVARTHGGTESGTLLDAAITDPAVLIVTATGTFTKGRARVVIEYVD